jgi:hypothetical protein
MTGKSRDLVIIIFVFGSFFGLYFFVELLKYPFDDINQVHWTISLLLNLLSYSSIIVPGYLTLKYVNHTKYNEVSQNNILAPVIKLCFFGNKDESITESVDTGEFLRIWVFIIVFPVDWDKS